MKPKAISTYIINLKTRIDRKKHIIGEFAGRKNFRIIFIDAHKGKIGAIGLWNTIKYISQDLVNKQDEFIILCEDDHQFTPEYSDEVLYRAIAEAKEKDADILSGGINGFTTALQISENLYWVEKFSGLQFTIIFRKFFKAILEANFGPGDAADYKMCSLTDKKFFIYPFISIQKDFGYSDATPENNKKYAQKKLFKQSNTKIKLLKKVFSFYNNKTKISQEIKAQSWKNITIPTYVINLPERTSRRLHIENQFKDKNEFNVQMIEACKHKIGAVGLWLSIRKVINMAIENDDDVIIICEDDHTFTSQYKKEKLIRNIFEAYSLGCDLLIGGVCGFNAALPVTNDLWWINSFWCTQFIVVFKRFFKDILIEKFSDTDTADKKFSEMTSQKMMIYPFLSIQQDFGYSDVTGGKRGTLGLNTCYFKNTDERLKCLQEIKRKVIK